MPLIALELIHSNPYRDFDLHPLDDEQVEKLKASIEADGFWAAVVARRVDREYQIAFGHHRIEAARRLGWQEVPIEVRDLSDWQMVRMLASENATQRGSTAAACLDAVAAIAKVLSFNLLRWDQAAFSQISEKVVVDYPSCRGRLEAGSGIGTDCVLAFAPKDAFTKHEVTDALGQLKDSGRMAAIIAEAHDQASTELQAEQEAAEREVLAAREREAAAKTKADKQAAAAETKTATRKAAKARKSTGSAKKAVGAVQRKPVTWDARCAQLFKIASHLSTFRRIITGETFQSYLKLDQQYAFAKSVIAALREAKPNKEITAADIRIECWSRIEAGLGMARGRMRTAPERPYLEEISEGLNMIRRAEGDFKRGVALLLRGFQLGEHLDAKQAERLDKMEGTFTVGWSGIKPHRENVKRHLKLIREE
jgi:ParB-like chromosome segregation protein Spo0J